MALDPGTLAAIRAETGPEPANAELEALLAVHGSVEGVAYAVLSARLAVMLTEPDQLTYVGDTATSWAATQANLRMRVAALRVSVSGPGQLRRISRRTGR